MPGDRDMSELLAGESLFEIRDGDDTTLFRCDAPYFVIADVSTEKGRRLATAVREIYGDTRDGLAGIVEVDRDLLRTMASIEEELS